MGANVRRRDDRVDKYGWGEKGATVEKWLFAEGYRFDFFQAVRLLEMIHAASGRQENGESGPKIRSDQIDPRVSPGEGADPGKEIVRFKSAVNLDFPASDIAEVKRGSAVAELPYGDRRHTAASVSDEEKPSEMDVHFKRREMPPEMTVNFLGLAGSLGALDIPTTELVLERESRNDKAFKDFLDIFNHRLISLLYRIRKHHRVGMSFSAPGEDQIAHYLYSLIGLDTPKLKGRMQVRDRSLLYYAGILAQSPRSMVGLERLLADYFQVEVKGKQFSGKWFDLEDSQWTLIGASGQNQRLGCDTVVLGSRVWDHHAQFEIHLGPLSLEEFVDFLPSGWRFGPLCDLIRFYVKDQFDFDVRLILKTAAIPEEWLKPSHTALAWTSWLGLPGSRTLRIPGGHKASPLSEGNPYVTVSSKSLRAEAQSIKSRVLDRLPRGKQSELLGMGKRSAAKNDVVMKQGDPGTCMYVIRRGTVQLSRRDQNEKETILRVIGEGNSFGERAFLAAKQYSETALALTECELSIVDRELLKRFAAKNPEVKGRILAYLAESEQANKLASKLDKRKR
jgi:type VI secretion system protein ImpH